MLDIDGQILCRSCAVTLIKPDTPATAIIEKAPAIVETKITMTTVKKEAPAYSSAWVGPEPGVIYPISVCHRHPKVGSIATCTSCNRGICAACVIEVDGDVVCRTCAITLRNKALAIEQAASAANTDAGLKVTAPAAEEVISAGPSPVLPASPAAPASSVQEPDTAKISLVSLASHTSATPASPLQSAKAGSYDPFISLVLSMVIPGYGQLYNGYLKKGLVLMAVYIIVWVLIVALLTRVIGGASWPLLLVAGLLILYSAYDAYSSASAAVKGKAAGDWSA